MLTTVTLVADMRPWRKGDDIHVSSVLAGQLVKNGEAVNPRPFQSPNGPAARAQEAPQRPTLHLGRRARR